MLSHTLLTISQFTLQINQVTVHCVQHKMHYIKYATIINLRLATQESKRATQTAVRRLSFLLDQQTILPDTDQSFSLSDGKQLTCYLTPEGFYCMNYLSLFLFDWHLVSLHLDDSQPQQSFSLT